MTKREAITQLLAAAEEMDLLMENLWKSVPWKDTYNLDIVRLNTAPIQLKKAIEDLKKFTDKES